MVGYDDRCSCAVLLYFVYLTLLASFFLPSSSLMCMTTDSELTVKVTVKANVHYTCKCSILSPLIFHVYELHVYEVYAEVDLLLVVR